MATARQLGYEHSVKELPTVEMVLKKILEAYTMMALLKKVVEQQIQMTKWIDQMGSSKKSPGNRNPQLVLTADEQCPKCA